MAEEDDVLDGEDTLDDVAGLAEDAAALEAALSSEDDGGGDGVDQMLEMEMLGGGGGSIPPNLERLMDVSLTVTIELGRTRETIETVMEYGDQSLIELDRTVGEPVDVLVNGELFARGEVVTVSENFGVRITELVNPLHN
jgi:flagellar motor switch protein FliN